MNKPTPQAYKRYKAFHGNEPSKLTAKNYKVPQLFVELANPEYITYFSDKSHGGGNGNMNAFKHKFDKSTKMFCSPDGKMLVIMGPKFRVTHRGLIG